MFQFQFISAPSTMFAKRQGKKSSGFSVSIKLLSVNLYTLPLSKKEGLCRQAKPVIRPLHSGIGKCKAWCRAKEMMLFEISWLSDVISKTRPSSWLVIFFDGLEIAHHSVFTINGNIKMVGWWSFAVNVMHPRS